VTDAPSAELLSIRDAVDPENPWLWFAMRKPGVLAGMASPPDGFPFSFLHEQGAAVLVSLTGHQDYVSDPLAKESFDLEDLAGKSGPSDAAAEQTVVRAAAGRTLDLVQQGVGVVVHCGMGIGRTGTVIGAVLVALGHDANDVERWLRDVQVARGCSGWPEAPWQRDQLCSLR
jgi:hypothetical protein